MKNEGSVSPIEYIELNYFRVKGIADVGIGTMLLTGIQCGVLAR